MNQRIRKAEIKNRVRDKLKKERIVIGGNGKGHKYSKRYHLLYKREIIDKVIDALIDVIVDIIEDGDTAVLEGLVKFESEYLEKERINELLGRLTEVQRVISKMKMEGFNNTEIFLILDIPSSTYYREINRIKATLEKYIA